MAQNSIKAERRDDFGKNASRRLRARGMIPAVVYGHDFENTALTVSPQAVLDVLTSEAGRNTIVSLEVGELTTEVVVREYQLDPIKGTLVHVDFQHIAMDETMSFEVPVEPVGLPKGVKEGGILDQVLRTIEVECLPRDVPAEIPVEVEALEIGDALRVSDLVIDSSKVQVLTDLDLVVLTIVPPRVEVEVVAAEEEEAEPELIRKGRVEEAGEEE